MKIADKLLEEGASESEREIVQFGVERLITLLIGLAAAIIAGLILHELPRTLLLLFVLFPLRQYAGGFHLKGKYICAVLSVLVLIGLILIIKYLTIPRIISMSAFLLGSLAIVFLAPVGNLNRQLDEDEKRVFGNRAKTVWLIETLAFFILWFVNLSYWNIILLESVVLTGLLVTIGYIQQKLHIGEKSEHV
ncbi:MAG: accessory gene regulator B family protein [Clostridiales bacterium]|nr:accessory gene regulator B family protein [Clostridiales bacterium]